MSNRTHFSFIAQHPLHLFANAMLAAERKDSFSLRTDFPFPPRSGTPVYFEITISDVEHRVETGLDSIMAIGFCSEFSDLIQSRPGWNMWSVGYHGDGGWIFEANTRCKYRTGRAFGPGNTVGCGIDYHRAEYYFTLGREVVGTSPSKKSDSLYEESPLNQNHIQPVAHPPTSYIGSYTLLSVTAEKHAKSR